jgi:hypothetical protein
MAITALPLHLGQFVLVFCTQTLATFLGSMFFAVFKRMGSVVWCAFRAPATVLDNRIGRYPFVTFVASPLELTRVILVRFTQAFTPSLRSHLATVLNGLYSARTVGAPGTALD